MLTAAREFRLLGQTFAPGAVIPADLWLAVPEQNRRAMVRTRFVRSPELAPSRAELRARQTASPVRAEPATAPSPSTPTSATAAPARRRRREH